MELSNEDALRLNVLLNQDLQAIRIDESKMIVYGLSDKGEATVSLNPNCRDEQYLKQVKELISTQVLGSPGGYPVFLRRWTRMGQTKDKSLDKLLQLGESEAVVAVVHAEGLTDDLARRAWWAMPCSENARCMLRRETVVQGEMGPVLAEFLLEFLPFEEEPRDIVESVRLVLQPGLIDEATKQDLWAKGQRKNAYLVGFLKTLPDALPEPATPHPEFETLQPALDALIEQGNPAARQLRRTLDTPGQAFLKTASQVMKKPANQDVVVALLEAMEEYFAPLHPGCEPCREVDTLLETARRCCEEPQQLPAPAREVIEQVPESRELAESALVLAQMGVPVVNPIFAATDSVGSVMRRKIEPVSIPFFEHAGRLLGES
ncbi:hypothetical protein [Thiohalophilus thiocyanatoxydans]|uniref:Sulfur reduction protein DsrS n=1 Tax=Thiohalophilus thiocyanatoxydans TaxID=381308 RepID=A0A4R8IPB2_9GAMM|nr:hypothetical protein [Thiohalophilus thiocyanatoxydans]TDY02761.1 hypothetical protein EDC23_1142 [Thiohalophilus thiocyanatoxydans]